MKILECGQKEIDHLKKKDKRMAALIDRMGVIEREARPDLFAALASSIVSQQISTKAAVTIHDRLVALSGGLTPVNIDRLSHEEIQQCGMSMKKAGYIKSAATAVLSKAVDLDAFHDMTDDEVIKQLVSLPGIGVWTAEMLMLFSLERPNILSYDDFAIRKGVMRLYGLEAVTKKEFEKYRKRYSPYGSAASLYLWALASE